MPKCKHRHQPQMAALVICPERYRALTERTVSMETDKPIEALLGCMDRTDCRKCPILGQCNGTFDSALHVTVEYIKAQDDQIRKRDYTILGIMHSVDKWLDGDELKADEINRAATMREKTLQIVERLTAQLTEKERQLAAAVREIPHVCRTCGRFDGGDCQVLRYKDYPKDCERWQWRGPQEAGEGGG